MFFNDLIFFIILIVYSYIQNRFLLYVFSKNKLTFLLDNNFLKPQAFHEYPTNRIGGIAVFFPVFLTFFYLYYFKNTFYFEFISFCSFFFILGIVFASVAGLLPISVAGLGIRDAALIMVFIYSGETAESAVAFSILIFFVAYFLNIFWGLPAWYLETKDISNEN